MSSNMLQNQLKCTLSVHRHGCEAFIQVEDSVPNLNAYRPFIHYHLLHDRLSSTENVYIAWDE